MKVYAREALEQYGVANYVLSEDRFVEDSGTGEIFNIPEDMIDTPEQLVRRLQKGIKQNCLNVRILKFKAVNNYFPILS